MDYNSLRFLGTLIFAVGMVDAINIVDFIPMNFISWTLAIIGIGLMIASKVLSKQNTD